MQPDHVVSLYLDLDGHGIEVWLVGGWGVDALLGRQTRDHHDLDVLVEVTELERFRQRLDELGLEFRYVWDEETWWLDDGQPTAFVCGHPDGRELDVHVVRRDANGEVATLWTVPYAVTAEALGGHGVVAGQRVRCITADMQRRAHTGYELPPHHAADMELLGHEPCSQD